MNPVALPQFLSHLKVYGGYPVPFTQMWIDGKPDFRVIDAVRVEQCVREKLCAICGRPLGEFAYFIGGPRSKENHVFADPAMHERCADFASRTCPFVSGNKHGYSDSPVGGDDVVTVHIAEMVSSHRPAIMYILKTRTKKITAGIMGESLMIQAGPWVGEKIIE